MFIRNRKGPLFTYWQLPYRQKFYRIVWMLPFALAFLLFPEDIVYFGMSRNQMAALVFALVLALAAYTYYRWKSTEREEEAGARPAETPDSE